MKRKVASALTGYWEMELTMNWSTARVPPVPELVRWHRRRHCTCIPDPLGSREGARPCHVPPQSLKEETAVKIDASIPSDQPLSTYVNMRR